MGERFSWDAARATKTPLKSIEIKKLNTFSLISSAPTGIKSAQDIQIHTRISVYIR
ncbi:hypothetical protein CIT292_06736 [Citrobacter youngae ATCC 29220]|uniref:Uncharacterized protein n=1 Tax=Citrobacter youngae ATCC 29220 TaxID=500640 RepID=D4B699_9ENTR|nr:hypothetical protein CIT292_06736 [Citrobacter youngae ATCC 29220]